jgi:hypothetical protein
MTPHNVRPILNLNVELAAFRYKLSRLQNAETGVNFDNSDPSQELR